MHIEYILKVIVPVMHGVLAQGPGAQVSFTFYDDASFKTRVPKRGKDATLG